jgi:hypothetical protein
MDVLVVGAVVRAEHVTGVLSSSVLRHPNMATLARRRAAKNRAWQAARSTPICKQGVVGSSPIISTTNRPGQGPPAARRPGPADLARRFRATRQLGGALWRDVGGGDRVGAAVELMERSPSHSASFSVRTDAGPLGHRRIRDQDIAARTLLPGCQSSRDWRGLGRLAAFAVRLPPGGRLVSGHAVTLADRRRDRPSGARRR